VAELSDKKVGDFEMEKATIQSFFATASWIRKLTMILVWALMAFALALTGISIHKIIWIRGAEVRRAEVRHAAELEAKKHIPAPEYTFPFQIRELAAGFYSKRTRRVHTAQFNLTFDCPSEFVQNAMLIHRPMILDVIYEVALSIPFEQITSPKGIQTFKKSLMAALSPKLKQYTPRELVVEDWIIEP